MHLLQRQPLPPSINKQRGRSSRLLAIDPTFESLKTLSTNKSSSFPLPPITSAASAPLGHRLLFGSDPHKTPQPTSTKPSNRHSLLLYNAAYGPLAPTDLLQRADDNWTRSHPYSRFGPSYHTSLPSHWAQQLLGLNLTVSLHRHFRQRILTLQSRHSQHRPTPSRHHYTPRGRPFYTAPYTSRLRTMRTHHDL